MLLTSHSTQDSAHPQKNYLEQNINSAKVAAGSKDRQMVAGTPQGVVSEPI